MRRLTITASLALGLIASLLMAAAVAARPYDPPGEVTVATAPCPSGPAAVVAGGVYRAFVLDLRHQGYTYAQIQAETANTLVVSGSGARLAEAEHCTNEQ